MRHSLRLKRLFDLRGECQTIYLLKYVISWIITFWRSCVDDIHYNQYDCISKTIVKRLNHEIGCKFPYHAFNKVLEEKTMCSNFSEYEGNLMMRFNFTVQIK